MLHGGPFLTPLLRSEGLLWAGWLTHLWSGLGLPFFLMLLAVVSLKWSRPTVTFVTCSGGRVTLQRMARCSGSRKGGCQEPYCRAATGTEHCGCLPVSLAPKPVLRRALPGTMPAGLDTHVTGLKGLLLLSDCDCSMLIDWFRASSWRGIGPGHLRTRFATWSFPPSSPHPGLQQNSVPTSLSRKLRGLHIHTPHSQDISMTHTHIAFMSAHSS